MKLDVNLIFVGVVVDGAEATSKNTPWWGSSPPGDIPHRSGVVLLLNFNYPIQIALQHQIPNNCKPFGGHNFIVSTPKVSEWVCTLGQVSVLGVWQS